MDYTNDPNWESAHDNPVSEEMNGRMVKFISEQTAIWFFHNPGDEDGFQAPVLILDIVTRNGESTQIILQPQAATALNMILGEHWAKMWGMLESNVVDFSDEAIDRLLTDIRNVEEPGE